MISPNKKKLHQLIWLTIGQIGVIIVAAIIAIFFIERIIVDVSDSLYQKRKITRTLELRKEIQEKLAIDLEHLKPHEKALYETLPSGNNILPFVETLDDLAKQRGIKQTYVFGVPSTPTGDFPVSRVDFTITIKANSQSAQAYIRDLLHIPFIVKINSILLSTPDGPVKEGTLNIAATLFVKAPE